VLEMPVGDDVCRVRSGSRTFSAREVDAGRLLTARRAAYLDAVQEVFDALRGGSSFDPAFDRVVVEDLIDLAPPGIDELFGIISVVAARADYDVIVVDTAPTGHALRLLEMPEAAREWTQALLRVLLKYKKLVRPGQLAEELLVLAKSVRELQAMLRDATHTRFVAVTRAAEIPRLETERLLQRLRRLQLSTPAVVVNALTRAPGACVCCRTVAAAERRSLAALKRTLRRSRRRSGECVIIQTPLSAPPPIGVSALEIWAESWIVDRAESKGLRAEHRPSPSPEP